MKTRRFRARVFTLSVFCAFAGVSAFAQDQLRDDLRRSFSKFDLVKIAGGENTPGGSRRIKLGVNEFDVEPHDIRSADYRAEDTNMIGVKPIERTAVDTYKGWVIGEPGSVVRLTMRGQKIEGFFQTGGGGRFYFEPAKKYSPKAAEGDVIVYRAEDAIDQEPLLCETDLAESVELGQQIAEAGRSEAVAFVRVIELATEADLEWVNTLGGPTAANNEIVSILNMVEGTYNTELGLSIQVVYQHTWSTTDPYAAGDMTGILNAFVSYWNANFGTVSRDAAHLFTAKSVAQSRGLAYVGVVCRSPQFAYGLSGFVNWATGRSLITGHEIGHNVGANHVDATQGCANSIMNANISTTTPISFCPFSRNEIASYVSASGSCLSESTPLPGPGGRPPFDFDGDRRSDASVFRPSNGTWYVSGTSAGFSSFRFGLAGDVPVAADYDGDGRSDSAVFRSGVWYRLKSATDTNDVISFGLLGDIPSPADFDGDRKADIAVFRPSTGTWYWLSSATRSAMVVRFGLVGDVPIPGDFDGDNRDDINLFRPSDGTWYRLNSSNGAFVAMRFGLSEDKPVAGDFDGDGRSDVVVWRPSNGVWYVTRSSTGTFQAQAFGLFGDIPTAADYDGDGRTDIAVYRPSSGVWYLLNSSTGAYSEFRFGLTGDIPVPSYYVR